MAASGPITTAASPPEDSRNEPKGAPATRKRRTGLLLPFTVAVVATFLITWFLFAMLTGYPVGLGPLPKSSSSSGGATGVVMTINNPFDTANNNTADQYSPANFTVPANTELEFTLINYDTGQNPPPAPDAAVSGTVGNCVYLNATPTSLGPCVKSVNDGFIAHTFSFVAGPYAGFNVPVPSAIDSLEGGIGASVTFFAYFNVTGTFTWNCLAPCDPWSMAHAGFMTGTMTVV